MNHLLVILVMPRYSNKEGYLADLPTSTHVCAKDLNILYRTIVEVVARHGLKVKISVRVYLSYVILGSVDGSGLKTMVILSNFWQPESFI